MTEFEKATPRPWFVFGNPVHCIGGPFVPAEGEDPTQTQAGIAMFGMRLRHNDEAEANARLTLRAVNSFDAISRRSSMRWPIQVIAALKLAEGDA